MHPIPVRLPTDLLVWLDQARGPERRSTLIREILRQEQRRRQKAQARQARHAQAKP